MMTMAEIRSGVDVLLEVLATEHVQHIFGNPGTTELPLMNALAGEDRFHYVLALHESVAAGMADGYAQATGRPSSDSTNRPRASSSGNCACTSASAPGPSCAIQRTPRSRTRATKASPRSRGT